MNRDVPAIGRAILDGGLSAHLEPSFHLRVIVHQKLDCFLVLTIDDVQ
ncbi:MAG TPA: hypothetical protein VJN89_01635 [Candidatus Acidoferrum sp.]|nr:hypothetical protein [Candidatus Acidoferrum sp.]